MKITEIDYIKYRYEYLTRGYLESIEEIKRFVPCGRIKAVSILKMIRDDNIKSGKRNLDGNTILVKPLMDYLGLTEKKIKESYFEQKKMSIS